MNANGYKYDCNWFLEIAETGGREFQSFGAAFEEDVPIQLSVWNGDRKFCNVRRGFNMLYTVGKILKLTPSVRDENNGAGRQL